MLPFYLTQFLAKLVDDSAGPQTNFVRFFSTNTITFRTNMSELRKIRACIVYIISKRVAYTYLCSTAKCFIPFFMLLRQVANTNKRLSGQPLYTLIGRKASTADFVVLDRHNMSKCWRCNILVTFNPQLLFGSHVL